MQAPTRRSLCLSGGTDLSYLTAGEPSAPAVLLLHGFPSSAQTFRDLIPALARDAYLIAPDLPGFGESAPLPVATFDAFGEAVGELLDHLEIGPRHLYVHDFGAPVAMHLAMRAPRRVLGLIVQNGSAHSSGMGPGWAATQAYWTNPTADHAAKATTHLSFEDTREQYLAGLPPEVAARVRGQPWIEDWRVMQLPGRLDMQRALLLDYGRYVARFDAVAEYLARWQPPAVLVWGRHDPYFELREVLSWMQALPRMQAHVLDGGHFLLETHAEEAASIMRGFIAAHPR